MFSVLRAFGRMTARCGLVFVVAPLAVGAAVWPATATAMPLGDFSRVSVTTSGTQGNGHSTAPCLSQDGRYVAFRSESNLIAGDTNGQYDVFLHDRDTGETTCVSVTASNVPGNGNSGEPSISADGRYVCFSSSSSNLVAADSNGRDDVFVRDTVAGTTTLVSVASNGAQGDGTSYSPHISADGRYVAFDSEATNLVSGDTNGLRDVFVHDLVAGTTTRVSVSASGAQSNGESWWGVLSADGRNVGMCSTASNLVTGDTNNACDVFVYDTTNSTMSRVSVTTSGAQVNSDSTTVSLSDDGRYVAFGSYASNVVPGDTNDGEDVFVRDRTTGRTTRISVSTAGRQGAHMGELMGSDSGVISGNGRYVLFNSWVPNLVPGDTNGTVDVFVRDLWAGTTACLSIPASGAQYHMGSRAAAMSGDGGYFAFSSDVTNLVSGDTNGQADVFVLDRGDNANAARIENDAAGVTFGRCITGTGAAYSGNSYAYTYGSAPYTGSTIEARFTGSRVRWIGPRQPSYGRADVYIDGVKKATVDCYAPASERTTSAVLWESATLSDGPHTIKVVSVNAKNAASTNYIVVVDCFEVDGAGPLGGGVRADDTIGTLTGAWIKTASGAYLGDGYIYSRWAGAKFSYTFTGTKVAWIGPRTTGYGKAAIYIDGVYKGTVSQYALSAAWRARVWESAPLASGTHTLEIRVLGTKDAASTGTIVVVDAIDVTP